MLPKDLVGFLNRRMCITKLQFLTFEYLGRTQSHFKKPWSEARRMKENIWIQVARDNVLSKHRLAPGEA